MFGDYRIFKLNVIAIKIRICGGKICFSYAQGVILIF